MRRRYYSCALFILFAAFLSVGQSRADVTYNYIAGGTLFQGNVGDTVNVPIFLQETVTQTGTNQTSLINRFFSTSDFSTVQTGLAQIGVGVEQTAVTGTASQILGGPVFTPNGTNPGVLNTAGWTYNPALSYDFTYKVGKTNFSGTGGNGLAQLYTNLTATDGTTSGNNLQVTASLGQGNSKGGFNANNGILTDAAYDSVNDRYGSGKVLIGTVSIQVAAGTTTFQVKPLGSTSLVGTTGTTFNGTTTDANSGTPTPLSGVGGSQNTLLAVTIFNNGTSGTISLDQSYNVQTRSGSASFDTYNSVNSANPTSGPDATPKSSSFLPFFNANPAAFTFTVQSVPEPSSMALCGLVAILGTGYGIKRRRKIATA